MRDSQSCRAKQPLTVSKILHPPRMAVIILFIKSNSFYSFDYFVQSGACSMCSSKRTCYNHCSWRYLTFHLQLGIKFGFISCTLSYSSFVPENQGGVSKVCRGADSDDITRTGYCSVELGQPGQWCFVQYGMCCLC